MGDDVRILKPVLRGVAVGDYFGKDDEIRAVRLCLFDRRRDLPYVPLYVAVSLIDLPDRNFHLF